MTPMLKAQYDQRGPIPQDVIAAVAFDRPVLAAGQALVAVLQPARMGLSSSRWSTTSGEKAASPYGSSSRE